MPEYALFFVSIFLRGIFVSGRKKDACINKPTYMNVAKKHLRTKKLSAGSCAVHGIGVVKGENGIPFGQHSDKRTQTRYFQFTKQSEQLYPLDVRSSKIS